VVSLGGGIVADRQHNLSPLDESQGRQIVGKHFGEMSLKFDLCGPNIPFVSRGSRTDFEGVREALRGLREHSKRVF
jgi:hypothetical protein